MGLKDRIIISWKTLPRVIQILVAIQVAVWVLLLPLPTEITNKVLLAVGFSPQLFLQGRIWQLFTHPFIHAPRDLFGLIFDVLLIWILGRMFALRWRKNHFLFFLGACAVGGALFGGVAVWAWPETFSPLITGMRAPVLGLFVAFHLVYGKERIRLMGLSDPIQAKWILYVVVGMDVLFFITGSNPDFAVQMGGLLTGWLLVTGRWRPKKLRNWLKSKAKDSSWEKKRRRFRVIDGGGGPQVH